MYKIFPSKKKVYKILSKKRHEIGAVHFLVLNKCTKYFLKKKSVQNIVKKKPKKKM